MLDNYVIDLVRDFLVSHVNGVDLHFLLHVRSLAIRVNSWWRVNPLRRALLNAAIMYLRMGFIVKSRALINMLRDAVIEALLGAVMRRLSFVAYVVGIRIAGHGKDPVIAGLQWLNRPGHYRWLAK
ncbi:MAG: hypothetical protein ACP5NQ_01380 [Vulcanisaeta sp.]